MTNPLHYFPDRARLTTYVVLAVVGVAIGATQVGFAAAEVAQPVWLDVALAVYAFLGGALGFTAATHTTPNESDWPAGESMADYATYSEEG